MVRMKFGEYTSQNCNGKNLDGCLLRNVTIVTVMKGTSQTEDKSASGDTWRQLEHTANGELVK